MGSQCHTWLYQEYGIFFFFVHYDLTFRIFPMYVVSVLVPVRLTEVLHYYYSILHVSSLNTGHENVYPNCINFNYCSSEIMF
jgi:hypothetical protein